MAEKENWPTHEEIEIERLREFKKLPVEEKLRLIDELNEFFYRAMPKKSKRAWEELKKQGF